ncbi:conserved hypothetical protein [Denitrovibrio acetiphilus DSM 12809]|uniref:KTSC domain-containing protein n=1 Tax=Denitrovibrio acetiphilus (strain DSM 12809 / NBRC 114555 / N2460) TaxID=522772 RepID=D4H4U8_DENA2|nr:KTSC domain-containing protein [Denitrovibrio acetiphilus]ADD67492.1 conserved hypothetical protein [Denitrovibrio acetiphilus DSM 12809]
MSIPEMVPVASSNVAEIGHDANTEVLFIRFNDGSLYTYKGVPVFEYEGLLSADSVGSYLHRNIKGNYPYERIG